MSLFIWCSILRFLDFDDVESYPPFYRLGAERSIYDDAIFGDELIGETLLDVEDRFFSMEWQNLDEKPIEYRQIYHPSSSLSQPTGTSRGRPAAAEGSGSATASATRLGLRNLSSESQILVNGDESRVTKPER